MKYFQKKTGGKKIQKFYVAIVEKILLNQKVITVPLIVKRKILYGTG